MLKGGCFSATFATRQAAYPLSEQLPLVDLSPNDRRFVCCLGFASNAQLDAKEGRVGPS
jgi:hypothetical protein